MSSLSLLNLLIFMVLLGGGATIASAGNYYVAPINDGYLGKGTQTDPFHSLSAAISTIPNLSRAPATLYLYPGLYTGLENTNLYIDINITLTPLYTQPSTVLKGFNKQPLITLTDPGKQVIVRIHGLDFIGGSTKNYGGAISGNFNAISELHIGDCVFESNSADTGGAIGFINRPGLLNITGSIFRANSATNGGDIAVLTDRPQNGGQSYPFTIEIDGCTFNRSSAAKLGASMWLGSSHRVQRSAFTNCLQTGCIHSIGALSSINNIFSGLTFRGTESSAIWLSGWHYLIHDCAFHESSDSALVIVGSSPGVPINVHLENCLFEDNKADIGAAIRIDAALSSSLRLASSTFLRNVGHFYGGAIAIFNGVVEITSSQFLQNLAGESGAAVVVGLGPGLGQAIANISNSFFECNTPEASQIDSTQGTVIYNSPSAFPSCS